MTDTSQAAPLQPSDGQGVDGAETTDREVADSPGAVTSVPTGGAHGGGVDEGGDHRLPSVDELNAAMHDGSGNAVSSQPFDNDPADLQDARERVAWDADTEPDTAPDAAAGPDADDAG